MTTKQHLVTDEQARAAEKRIRLGQSTILSEAQALGFSNRRALRTALTTVLGGREQYRALLAAGREARHED